MISLLPMAPHTESIWVAFDLKCVLQFAAKKTSLKHSIRLICMLMCLHKLHATMTRTNPIIKLSLASPSLPFPPHPLQEISCLTKVVYFVFQHGVFTLTTMACPVVGDLFTSNTPPLSFSQLSLFFHFPSEAFPLFEGFPAHLSPMIPCIINQLCYQHWDSFMLSYFSSLCLGFSKLLEGKDCHSLCCPFTHSRHIYVI